MENSTKTFDTAEFVFSHSPSPQLRHRLRSTSEQRAQTSARQSTFSASSALPDAHHEKLASSCPSYRNSAFSLHRPVLSARDRQAELGRSNGTMTALRKTVGVALLPNVQLRQSIGQPRSQLDVSRPSRKPPSRRRSKSNDVRRSADASSVPASMCPAMNVGDVDDDVFVNSLSQRVASPYDELNSYGASSDASVHGDSPMSLPACDASTNERVHLSKASAAAAAAAAADDARLHPCNSLSWIDSGVCRESSDEGFCGDSWRRPEERESARNTAYVAQVQRSRVRWMSPEDRALRQPGEFYVSSALPASGGGGDDELHLTVRDGGGDVLRRRLFHNPVFQLENSQLKFPNLEALIAFYCLQTCDDLPVLLRLPSMASTHSPVAVVSPDELSSSSRKQDVISDACPADESMQQLVSGSEQLARSVSSWADDELTLEQRNRLDPQFTSPRRVARIMETTNESRVTHVVTGGVGPQRFDQTSTKLRQTVMRRPLDTATNASPARYFQPIVIEREASSTSSDVRSSSPSYRTTAIVIPAVKVACPTAPVFYDSDTMTSPSFSVATSECSTVDDVISDTCPEFRISGLNQRESSYDNIAPAVARSATPYSTPWDSAPWAQLFVAATPSPSVSDLSTLLSDDEGVAEVTWSSELPANGEGDSDSGSRALIAEHSARVHDFVCTLGRRADSTFGKNVDNFISCTQSSRNSDAKVALRNVRQFMSGIKRFLLQKGEPELDQVIDDLRLRLPPDRFLNVELLVETALQSVVVRPLHQHLYKLLVQEHRDTGSLVDLSVSVNCARNHSAAALGLPVDSESTDLREAQALLLQMTRCYSPLGKLQNLVAATVAVLRAMKQENGAPMGDFLPVLVYALVQNGGISSAIESEYMWSLLPNSALAGEAAFCLATLDGAVHIIRTLRPHQVAGDGSFLSVMAQSDGFVRVLVADEATGKVSAKLVPLRSCMTVAQMHSMLSHKLAITNAHDFALYVIAEGVEEKLDDGQLPLEVRTKYRDNDGDGCVFAFRRKEAHLLWPSQLVAA